METEKSKVDQLIDHAEQYFQTRQELSKMIAAEKSSVIISSVVSNLAIAFIFFFVFLFASIALAYGLSQAIGEAFAGFLIVAFLYFILGIILFAMRDRLIKTPITNTIIKSFFKEQDDE